MQKEYDVAVIGAGPAGSCAALFSSKGGATTVVVDRKSVIGEPVQCGEFIPSLEAMQRFLPEAGNIEKMYALIPPDAIANRTKLVKFYSPNNKCFEFKFDGLVLNRNLLQQFIVEKAVEHGAHVRTSCSAKAVVSKNGFKNILVKEKVNSVLKAKALIGADGFPSQTAAWVCMESNYGPRDMTLAIHKTMINVESDENTVEMYTGTKYAPWGYAWIIPKSGKKANVGLGVRLSHFHLQRKGLMQFYFENFLRRHPVASKKLSKAKPLSLSAKIVPVGGRVKEVCKNGVVLVGDAAGLVTATNGSGIPTAMLSGCAAGNIASMYTQGKCGLDVYEDYLKSEIDPVLRLSVTYRQVADIFFHSDLIFSWVLQLIGVRGVSKVIKCERLLKQRPTFQCFK